MKGKPQKDRKADALFQQDETPLEVNEQETMKDEKDAVSELDAAKSEARENYDKYLRLAAEFDNYKKRVQKERADLLNYGNEKLLKEVLPLVDALERALGHAEKSVDFDVFVEGLKLILDQFTGMLGKNGVEAIESVGSDFDPNFHEAMIQVESKDHQTNEVVEEFEKGYMLNGRLLRPAKVSVAKRIH